VPSFDDLGLSPRDRAAIDGALASPQGGLVLFTGPMGSGKTTSLYSALAQEASAESKVMVADESPLPVPRVVAVRVDDEGGLTYPVAIRGCLASDPDVVGIGEIGDGETMRAALECGATGHPVFACACCNSAVGGLQRLLHLCGGEARALDEVKLVTSQRLVRRLCDCAVGEAPGSASLRRLQMLASGGGLAATDLRSDWRIARGCPRCHGTGMRGRLVLMEVMEVTHELRQALARGAGDDELRAIATGQGMATLVADGIRKASRGEIALAELLRWFPDLIKLE
jgi:type II secretory ATPase GspE/PulE/Tfp pilus assembly ATPase PilB-like protein